MSAIGGGSIINSIQAKLKGFHIFNKNKIHVDGAVARLHYTATFRILLISCLIVGSGSFFGNPITCMQDQIVNSPPIIRPQALDQYCYVASTFSVPSLFLEHKLGKQGAHIGVGPINGEDVKYHNYYQWVPFVLLLQGLMFYTPHYIWKNVMGGIIKNLAEGLTVVLPAGLNDEVKQKLSVTAQYLYNTKHEHKAFGLKYVFCEILYFVNVVGQMFFIDHFLGGVFLHLGVNTLNFLNEDPEVRTDPLARVFPRLTKCTFQKFGPSGTIQVHDALCLLPINIINEKIYIFLWFWFVILAAITGLGLLYTLAALFVRSLRSVSLGKLANSKVSTQIDTITRYFDFSDWLLLNILKTNIRDQKIYVDLLQKISKLMLTNGNHYEEALVDKDE